MPIKTLSFKGDKKVKKRKHREVDNTSKALIPTNDIPSEEDDSWTYPDVPADLTGPTLLLLPTKPVTCLASDAHGNIFASPIENIVDDNPETAEPHDVRQVWVANRVAGLKEGQVTFKGSHGGYLGCDEVGVVKAEREAVGVEEGFEVLAAGGDGESENEGRRVFRIRTIANKKTTKDGGEGDDTATYLSAVSTISHDVDTTKSKLSVSIRGDGEAKDESTVFRIRMQARFKPRLKANKEQKAQTKISRRELEADVGRRLEDHEVKKLKRARRDGTYHEEVLDVRVKGKHDKFAS